MNRRKFLTTTAAGALMSAHLKGQEQERRASFSQSYSPDFVLDEVTASSLQDQIRSGARTSEQIVRLYLDRIAEIDRSGPRLRAVIEINPDAIEIASKLDAEFKLKGLRGPLHGLPVVLKDNIDTGDKMQTTAGSLALAGRPAAQDSPVAKRLRAAGAVILGKTNLSEWANFRSTRSTSGWSGRGGQTKNPYVLDRNPCGSSSGSGVAVSANLAALAVGTETDGSVVCPSAICGIVGIKPTLGLISRTGIVPIAHSQDTAGPMARTVRDAALLLGALAGPEPLDEATQAKNAKFFGDYTQFLDPNGLRGARIGIARQYFTMGPGVTAVIEECIGVMRDLGAQIVDPADLPSYEKWRETELLVLLYEFKADLNSYLTKRNAQVKSLEDCIAFNRAHRKEEMPFFEQELMERAQQKGPLTEKDYKEALSDNRRLARKEGIDAALKKFKVDAIVAPTAGPAWPTDLVGGDKADSGCASPAAVAGYPHITVPAGFVFGLPLGISFFGAAWSEPTLLKFAFAFEQACKARCKPEFAPTVIFSA